MAVNLTKLSAVILSATLLVTATPVKAESTIIKSVYGGVTADLISVLEQAKFMGSLTDEDFENRYSIEDTDVKMGASEDSDTAYILPSYSEISVYPYNDDWYLFKTDEGLRYIKSESVSKVELQRVPDEYRDIFARVVFAEAGNQGLYGMQLVAAVILNRIDYGMGESITDVIYAPGQFTCVRDGGIYRHNPNENAYLAMDLEYTQRSNAEILFFRTRRYHGGKLRSILQYKDHYFSGL